MAKAAELMKTIPVVAVPAAYVGLFLLDPEIEARTFDAEGNLLETLGPWTPSFIPSAGPPDLRAVFLRGETEGSLAGCSFAFIEGVADPVLYVLDLEALDLVAVATTHRPSVAGGQTIQATIAATGGFFWECGARLEPVDTDQEIGYLRKVSADGQTITSVSASFNLFNDGFDREAGPPLMIEEDKWAVPTISLEGVPTNPGYVDTITTAAAISQIADRTVPEDIFGAVPLGATSGGTTTRVVLSGTEYVLEALFDITDFTASVAGTLRDGTLIAVQNIPAESRICTYAGSHPITTGTEGPVFPDSADILAIAGL